MKIFFKQLFCRHKYELKYIDRKVVLMFGWNPIYHYKCAKCNKKITEKL